MRYEGDKEIEGDKKEMRIHKGRRERKPDRDIMAKPSTVVLL